MTKTSWPAVKHELNTTRLPNSATGTDTWVDLTDRVNQFSVKRGRTDELTDVQAGTMDWTLRNGDGRFDPTNSASDLYPNLRPNRMARSSATWGTNLGTNTNFASGSLSPLVAGTRWTVPTAAASTPWGGSQFFGSITRNSATSGLGYVTTGTGTAGTVGVTYTVTVWIAAGAGWSGPLLLQAAANSRRVTGTTFTPVAGGTRVTSQITLVTGETQVNFWLSDDPQSSPPNGGKLSLLAWKIEAGTISDPTWDPGSTRYPIYYGYEEKGWPLAYDMGGRYSWATPSFVDAFGPLGQITLADAVTSELLVDSPLALYTLNDPTDSLTAKNVTGTLQPDLAFNPRNTASATFGTAVPLTRAPDSATGVTISLPTPVTGMQVPTCGIHAAVVSPAAITAFTHELWFATTSTVTITQLVYLYCAASSGMDCYVTVQPSGITATFEANPGTTTATLTISGNFCDGQPHRLALLCDSTSSDLWVDGNHATGVGLPFNGLTLQIQGTPAAAAGSASVALAEIVTYNSRLSTTRLAAHLAAASTGFAGEIASARVTRLLNYAGWQTANRSIGGTPVHDSGDTDTPLQALPTSLAGTTSLAALQAEVDSVLGILDVTRDGLVRYLSRDYKASQLAPSVVFGEFQALGEIPYLPDAQFAIDPTFLYAVISIEQNNGITVNRSNATAVQELFGRTLTRQVDLLNPQQIIDQANCLLRQYKAGIQRAQKITVEPSSNPALWPMILGLDLGTRVRVMRRMPYTDSGGTTHSLVKQVDGYVESIDHTVTTTSWQVGFQMSPVPALTPWILGDSTYGVLGSTTVTPF